jgi:hypothetical protein
MTKNKIEKNEIIQRDKTKDLIIDKYFCSFEIYLLLLCFFCDVLHPQFDEKRYKIYENLEYSIKLRIFE